ncbi:putative mitochondrial protein [Cardamine amara subsp. amara]|uniref:Mitochondrial protein n=1 Tax=Cardamine amara subsp. amara TaxID=228776 RepID=A0ABD0Z472_CARAN
MAKEARQGKVLYAICFSEEPKDISPLTSEIQTVVQEFEDLFDTPNSLPPHRPIEHHITMKEGANPVNVRPYRYAHFQKGEIGRPLTNLLRKGQFSFGAEANEAFEKLKTAMTTTPTLALPDFTKPFVIQTDAFDQGIGAVLSQNEQPISFMYS